MTFPCNDADGNTPLSWCHRAIELGASSLDRAWVVVFLFLHVIDTSSAVFYPIALYVEAVAAYQSPLFHRR
ncbi:MAG UNVERIFIED_CONTAM: hypothetical protein LVT10_27330 [Anaerolineae bacterium]|jgi:hypothetical protein